MLLHPIPRTRSTALPHTPCIVGIDPGKSGGIAFLWPTVGVLHVAPMPSYEVTRTRTKTFVDEEAVHQAFTTHGPLTHAWIEDVHAMPTDAPAYAFSFGMAYGVVLGVLGALQVPRSKEAPAVWKRAMKAPADKKQSVSRAKELMPACAPMFVGPRGGLLDGNAEAAMIALYGAMKLGYRIDRAITPQREAA